MVKTIKKDVIQSTFNIIWHKRKIWGLKYQQISSTKVWYESSLKSPGHFIKEIKKLVPHTLRRSARSTRLQLMFL